MIVVVVAEIEEKIIIIPNFLKISEAGTSVLQCCSLPENTLQVSLFCSVTLLQFNMLNFTCYMLQCYSAVLLY